VVSVGMVLAMVKAFGHGIPRMTSLAVGEGAGSGADVGALGLALLRSDQGYVFAFELLSFLLLSALVGAIVVARKEND
jgi:NADH:ubiquinone oxidoreductase subunit 6 (subunit J)